MTTRIDKCTFMNDVKPGRLEVGRQQGRPRNHYIQYVRDWTDMSTYSVYKTARRRDGEIMMNEEEWSDAEL